MPEYEAGFLVSGYRFWSLYSLDIGDRSYNIEELELRPSIVPESSNDHFNILVVV